jgi:hypothetical protein
MANYFSTALNDYLSNDFNAPVTGNVATTLTNFQGSGTALQFATYDSAVGVAKLANCGYQQNGVDISTILQPKTNAGGHLYTNSTTSVRNFTFTVPTGITSICILCVGGSGTNTKNNPPNSSWFGGSTTNPIIAGSTVICYAGGGSGTGSGFGDGLTFFIGGGSTATSVTQATGAVTNSGGLGGNVANGGGGGAGGYSGSGGAGGGTGVAGSGGGGGGGNAGRGGGGVGLYPTAITNGAANGGGGSGGQSATTATGGLYGGGWCYGSTARTYGGGGGALTYLNNYPVTPGTNYNITVGLKGGISTGGGSTSGGGAVRIIWGTGRSFPITNVSSAFNETTN